MSRLSLLVAGVLSVCAASAHAVIVFEPAPVPTANCATAYQTFNPFYPRELYPASNCNSGYQSIDVSTTPCSQPTVMIQQCPCPPASPAPLFWRKADFLPGGIYAAPAADPMPAAPATEPAPATKGTIFIIPKNLLDRPLKSFQSQSPTAELGRRA